MSFVVVLAALIATACDRPTTPTPAPFPSPALSPSPADFATVSGVVWRHDTGGITPYSNVAVGGWVQTQQSGSRINAMTDAGGRYRLPVPIGASLRLQVDTNYQPCFTEVYVTEDASRDVHVVADTSQLGAHLPPELLADSPTLSGLVFENTGDGRRPITEVRVELDMLQGLGDVSASTLTDADGGYSTGGLRGVAGAYVYALKSGYALGDVGMVSLNGDTARDIELRRNR